MEFVPKCMKCAEAHLTEKCLKDVKAAAKCVNCGGNHPANYRGCNTAKEAQRNRNKLAKTKISNLQQSNSNARLSERISKEIGAVKEHLNFPTTSSASRTYAEAAMNPANVHKSKINEQPSVQGQFGVFEMVIDMTRTLKEILSRLEKLEKVSLKARRQKAASTGRGKKLTKK